MTIKYLVIFLLSFSFLNVFPQNSTNIDSVFIEKPKLSVKISPGLLILSLYSGAYTMGFTGHKYYVNDTANINAKVFKPIFQSSTNEIAKFHFNQFENSKKTSTVLGGIGVGIYMIGLIKALSTVFTIGLPVKSTQEANRYLGGLIVGGAMITAAPIIKIRGISKLKKAIKSYNEN